MRLTRADRSILGDWWFTVDRLMLTCILMLIAGGLVLSLAASPPVATRLGLGPFHFVVRHALAVPFALTILFVASLQNPREIRRLCLGIVIVGFALMVLTLLFGAEIKGARRWLQLGPFALQASEFVKPAFVIMTAWMFSESERRPEMPGLWFAILTYVVFVTLLVLEPDFGQTLLVSLVWGALFFLAGLPMIWIGLLAGAGAGGLAAAYMFAPHVASRIDRFLDPASGDTFQTDRAFEAFQQGGWLGQGPGEGTVKQILPDSHTDFIFAVVAEEFGLIACLAIVALFAFVVLRGFRQASRESDGFVRFASIGLLMLFGVQAGINMAVNVGLVPAKGMTLPLISYGGSSMMSMALAMGFLLGLTRKRPSVAAYAPPTVAPLVSPMGASEERTA